MKLSFYLAYIAFMIQMASGPWHGVRYLWTHLKETWRHFEDSYWPWKLQLRCASLFYSSVTQTWNNIRLQQLPVQKGCLLEIVDEVLKKHRKPWPNLSKFVGRLARRQIMPMSASDNVNDTP